ncbi:MAG: YggS family pyridoxal phosphate-dependent enzyme [Fibrobacteria bacterium]|nr:YggS family pyridoxal phosphate-dependent enzyme [Fibrobacteria bacterium]
MSLVEEFRARAAAVEQRVSRACLDNGRDPSSVRIIAVSKRHPAEAVDAAMQAGYADFGENYVQEAVDKFPREGARLHFIGSLQRNKVRRILPLTHLLHGVGSLSVAQAVERIAGEEGLRPRFLLQLHLTGEPTKNGLLAEELEPVLEACAGFRHARLSGFMAMAPLEGGPAAARPVFDAARAIFDRHRADLALDTLSMGMSDDLEIAVACGTTHVRVGTALFGERATASGAL